MMATQSPPVPVPGTGPLPSYSGVGDQYTALASARMFSAKDNATIYAPSYYSDLASPHEWLEATDPRCDKSRIEMQKGYQQEKNQEWCDWIFSNHTFKEWLSHEESKLLWIHGDAETGKTMLLAGIIDELETPPNRPRSSTVAYYFCEQPGHGKELQDATAVFRGLIAILHEAAPALRLSPESPRCWLASYKYGSDDSVHALRDLLKRMIRTSNHTVYFIIDAYDEYEKMACWEDLLDAIRVLSSSCSKVRWLMSSRNDCKSIREWYEGWTKSKKGAFEIDMSSESFSSALGKYIDEKLSRLTWLREEKMLRKMLRKRICDKANSRYFWASFICDQLEAEKLKFEKLKSAKPESVHVLDLIEVVSKAPAHLGDMKAGSQGVQLAKDRYDQVDDHAHEGYVMFNEFKSKLNMARSGNHDRGADENDGSIYDLLKKSIEAHRKAIDKAKEAHPHYHPAIIKADIGTAESYRELSHSPAFSEGEQLQYIRLAENHLTSAITRSREKNYGPLEQRAMFEKAILLARKVIVSEKLEEYVRDDSIRAILVGWAHASQGFLNETLEKSDDANTHEWTNWWLNELDHVFKKLGQK